MFPWNKWPWTNYHELNLDWIVTRVRELYEWVNRTLKQFTEDLQQETSDRIEADQQLQANIDKEQAAREAADQQLQENINAEAAAREAADTQLQNNIDAEEAAREAADTALGQRIDQEIQDRTAADTALGARIDQEIQDRTNADTALGQRIDTETSERKAADQQLQNNIDAEEAAREAADTQLQNNIDTLRSDAILKDGSTTTTAPIPFAQGIKTGSIAETTPDAGVSIEALLDLNSHKITALANGTENTDAVNLGQMNTADDQAVQEAVGEANSYTDSQLESFSADVHSIPAGGSSGQVLAKVDGTNYNVTWVDQQGVGSGGDVPAGGTTGQVLAKSTDADYQTEWVNQPEGLPAGGTTGQVVTKTADGAEWADAPSGLPTGGTTGQVLAKATNSDYQTEWVNQPEGLPAGGTEGQVVTKTADGAEWTDAPSGLPTGGTNGQILSIIDDSGTVGWINPEQAAGAPSITTAFGTGNRFFYTLTTPSQSQLNYSFVNVYTMNKVTLNSSYNFSESIPQKVRPTEQDTYRNNILSTDGTSIPVYISGTTMNIDTSNGNKVIPAGTLLLSYMRKAQ